jgi:hypothetical protein
MQPALPAAIPIIYHKKRASLSRRFNRQHESL